MGHIWRISDALQHVYVLLEQTVNIFFYHRGSGTNLQITSIALRAVGVATEVGRARGLGPRFSNEIYVVGSALRIFSVRGWDM